MNLRMSIISIALFINACQGGVGVDNTFNESCDDPQGEGGSSVVIIQAPVQKPLVHMVMSEHSDASPAHNVFQMSARCPEGEQLISGGCQWWDMNGGLPPLPLMDEPGSISYNEPYIPDEWICQGAATAPTNRIWAFAVCMKF